MIVPKKPASSEEPELEDELASYMQDETYHTPNTQQASSVYATPATRRKNDGSPTPKARATAEETPAPGKQSAKRNKRLKKANVTPKDESIAESRFPDEIPSSTWESNQAPVTSQDALEEPASSLAPNSKKIMFGSEEPVEATAPIALGEPQPSNTTAIEEDSGSDSDEAPEVVTTASAASKAKAVQEEATRAYQAQQEKEKQKRQERAERIAEEQAEKRKREEKKAKKIAKRLKMEEDAQPSLSKASLGVDIHNLPALLPDSLLEAAGDRRPATLPPIRRGKTAEELRKEKLNRHTKFLERSEKPVKDVKKGSVNVSVLAKQNVLLAPKANKGTKNIREHWLKGRQAERKRKNGKPVMQFKRMERRATGGGFLKGDD